MSVESTHLQGAVNAQAAKLVFERLAASGPFHCVLSPGGRNAPLAFALSAYPEQFSTVILDERQAGFFALGRALGRPDVLTVLMCTSGSAGAHYLPALIEADYSGTPLLVITADRPDHLRGAGAAQTIDQRNFYGHHVLAHAHVNVDATTLQVLDQELNRLIECATNKRGPVHLNLGFDEPLYVKNGISCSPMEAAPIRDIDAQLPDADLRAIRDFLVGSSTGLLILGPNAIQGDSEAGAMQALISTLQWPCFAHAASGMPRCEEMGVIEGAIDHWITNHGLEVQSPVPVFYLGQAPTSRTVLNYLSVHPHVVSWSRGRHRTQPWRNGDAFNGCTAQRLEQLVVSLSKRMKPAPTSYEYPVKRTHTLKDVSKPENGWGGPVFNRLCEEDQKPHQLLVGNSLPIRDLDLFCNRIPEHVNIFANRGVNGIDGHIATACGLAAAHPEMKTVLVCGDLTALHDVGALSLAKNTTLAVIILDNGGGGIFSQLPFAESSARFERFFTTPQAPNLTAIATAFGMKAEMFHSWEEGHIDTLLSTDTPSMSVFKIDSEEARTERTYMLRQIAESFERE
ncbi:MAG: 2-succinyl-5-enolpyruvyl-6-hydroxy-3-cyclohexene-1-carboxylic-acid synthase [Bradymonadia bacterium]